MNRLLLLAQLRANVRYGNDAYYFYGTSFSKTVVFGVCTKQTCEWLGPCVGA